MDAIALLTEDHRVLRELLDELAATTSRATKRRVELLAEITIQLKAHTLIEEEIFYPRLRDQGAKAADAKMYFEALEEHRAAGELVLPDLLDTPEASDAFSGRAKVLKELVTHHAEEEEQEMFPRARELFSAQELEALGERLAARKEELIEEFRGIHA